jgi:hypothetical protein
MTIDYHFEELGSGFLKLIGIDRPPYQNSLKPVKIQTSRVDSRPDQASNALGFGFLRQIVQLRLVSMKNNFVAWSLV